MTILAGTLATPSTSFLLPLEDAGDAPRKVGSKAVELAALLRRGVPVPTTWVLDVSPFRAAVEAELSREHEPRALLRLRKPMARMERAAQARVKLLSSPLSSALTEALESLWQRLEPLAPQGLAVRASPSVDDDSLAFTAGLTGAELGLRGGEALADAVRRLWALVFSPRALTYLADRKVRDLGMAVLFQPVVAADAAGMLVTRPRQSRLARDMVEGERLLNLWGGARVEVEGGDARCDVVRLSASGAVVERQGSSGFDIQKIHTDALSSLASRLDALDGGTGYEVQFAFEGERLLVLQAQRGQGKGFPEGGDRDTVWSRTTVTESLSGVVSPLTLSLSEPFVEESFRSTFERLGCATDGERLIAGVNGRAYLNLSSLMRMAVQLPGLDARSVVQLAGVEGADALVQQLDDVSRRGFYTRLPLTIGRQIAEQSAIGTLIEHFDSAQADEEQAIEEIDLLILPDDALVPRLRDLQAMLGNTSRTLATATTAYVTSHLALRAVIARTLPDEAQRLAQAVSAGAPSSEAIRPAVALARVAAIAREEEPVRQRILDGSVQGLDALAAGPTRAALWQFIAEHGHLARLSVELMNPRWREDAAPLLAMVAALLRGGRDGERAAAEARARADRDRADLERRLPLVDRVMVRSLVERCRRLTGLRERARGRFLRAMALWRKAALDIDRRLRRVDPSLPPDAVFFCTFDELLAALGTGRPRVAHLVKPRIEERARDLALPDPPTTFVGAPPAYLLPRASGPALRGVAASAGLGPVTGRARVLHDLRRDAPALQRGEILVVKSADLGLSPLFLVASAVISQQGGRLTQGAVVARELGVPAVASVSGATRLIRDGELLRVDGAAGTIERLSSP